MSRALAPEGVVADIRSSKIEITRKRRPAELDEWTHYLYDATNNAVSSDTAVDHPRGLRWTCGPRYARSHEHAASLSAMVAAGGRIFTITDEGPISSVYLPPEWKLAARDAFSGVLLWERPIGNWESQLRLFRSGPPEIGRRLVAVGDRVYVTLGYGEPVTVLDAATGSSLRTLSGTEGARELLLTGGTLYVLADDMTATQHNQRKDRIDDVTPTLEYWFWFPFKAVPMYGIQRIAAVETGTGQLLWEQGFREPGEVMPATMAMSDGRVCLQTVSHVVCLDAVDGRELWRSERPVATSRYSWSTPTLVVSDGVVLTVDRTVDNVGTPPAQGSEWLISGGGGVKKQKGEMVTFSLDDGRELWRAPSFENYNTPLDIFVIDGVVWVGNLRHGNDAGFTGGRDLRTGKVIATLPAQKGYGHHRCYRNKATVRWMLLGRNWIEFLDPKSGDYNVHRWVRGACQYGIMPANGLIYVPQHSCGCNPEELITGFNALSPRPAAGEGLPPLRKGPAYDEAGELASASDSGWPTYRGDVARSGYQDLPAPGQPAVIWTKQLTPPITAPVAANGLVVVAETERHTVHALSAEDGMPLWSFVADGRIDSPPTLYGGLCLFGTRSGFVYCVRASDGVLVWRFRAASRDRRIFAYGQLESVWPVHGSVLVDEKLSGGVATAYVAAGRSGHIDGGIRLYALAVGTGKVLHQADINMADGVQGAGIIKAQVLPDILSIQGNAVWMRGMGVDQNLNRVERVPHFQAPRGFLDDTWWHRTYWIYGTQMEGGYSGWPMVGTKSPAGRLLAYDGSAFYGYGRMANPYYSREGVALERGRIYRNGQLVHPEAGHVAPDATKNYRLFSEVFVPKQAGVKWEDRERRINWTAEVPFIVRSVVLTGDSLLLAGGASLTESAANHGPGSFWVASREDGSKEVECTLPAPPVLDGMALTEMGVFVSAIDGSLLRVGDAR